MRSWGGWMAHPMSSALSVVHDLGTTPKRWDDLTALAVYRMGYGIYSRNGNWFLRTPFAGDIPCPSYNVAWRSLLRVIGWTA